MAETLYVVTAPLVDVRVGGDSSGGGHLARVHKGGTLPIETDKDTVKRLLGLKMIVESSGDGGLPLDVVAAAQALAAEKAAKPGPKS